MSLGIINEGKGFIIGKLHFKEASSIFTYIVLVQQIRRLLILVPFILLEIKVSFGHENSINTRCALRCVGLYSNNKPKWRLIYFEE